MIWFNSLYIFLFCMSYVSFSGPPSIQELYNDYVCLIHVHDKATSLVKIPCEKFNDTNMLVLHENNTNERYADQALDEIDILAKWCRLQEHGCFCLQADELGEADHERLYRIFLGTVKPFASFFIKVDKEIVIDRVYFIPTYLFMESPIEAYRVGKVVTRDIEVPLLEDIFDGDLGHITEQPTKEGRMYLFAKRYGSYVLAQYFIAYKKISGWWKSLSLPTFKVPS